MIISQIIMIFIGHPINKMGTKPLYIYTRLQRVSGSRLKKKIDDQSDNSFPNISIQSGRNPFFHDCCELISLCPNIPIIETVLMLVLNVYKHIIIDNWQSCKCLSIRYLQKLLLSELSTTLRTSCAKNLCATPLG